MKMRMEQKPRISKKHAKTHDKVSSLLHRKQFICSFRETEKIPTLCQAQNEIMPTLMTADHACILETEM